MVLFWVSLAFAVACVLGGLGIGLGWFEKEHPWSERPIVSFFRGLLSFEEGLHAWIEDFAMLALPVAAVAAIAWAVWRGLDSLTGRDHRGE